MELEYLLIDVFTDRPFGGSRLYLFPDGTGVPRDLMQNLAMELGAGETAFIVPSTVSDSGMSRLRVFTPAAEIPFGGHSVIGATFALDQTNRRVVGDDPESFTWELEAGQYEVVTSFENGNQIYSLRQDSPVFMGQYFHRGKVARTLGLPEDDIAITGLPCEVISTGLPIHIVPLASLDAMERIILRHRDSEAIARDLGFGDLFVFTCETVQSDATVHCRMFAPYFGIPEDAASGAATGALVAYLVKHRLVKYSSKVRIICEQGLEMGRPSRLIAEAGISGGQATAIQVGGQCVLVGSGSINIP
ncbi:MAG: PhzF family phenazine biosynthesis protein [Candidatus Krumholzibacteria bacterium]|nr:PhzF family phenazine biosynthesis protein [Candidatus Krumholzibacteria bacterium]